MPRHCVSYVSAHAAQVADLAAELEVDLTDEWNADALAKGGEGYQKVGLMPGCRHVLRQHQLPINRVLGRFAAPQSSSQVPVRT